MTISIIVPPVRALRAYTSVRPAVKSSLARTRVVQSYTFSTILRLVGDLKSAEKNILKKISICSNKFRDFEFLVKKTTTDSPEMIYRDIYRSSFTFELIEAPRNVVSPWQIRAKRVTDILLSGLGIVLLSPVMLVICILLKLKGEGQVIYSQERIGLGGKPFTIYKFKTFRDDAELDGPQLSLPGDSRVTPLGKTLREHHLDELPQLWNVLRGDMSMVGPRPERKYFIDKIMKYDSRYQNLYVLRPGVTSDATLHNGYTDTMEKMLKRLDRDLYYLENRSLTLDFKIIIETALSIISLKKF